MWKIGPECAAQHAKKASAIAANCGEVSACATVKPGPSVVAAAAAGASAEGAGAPQMNALTPMQSQLISAVVDMPVRDQPIASDIGCKNTLSESIAPTPTHVMTMPDPTMNQP